MSDDGPHRFVIRFDSVNAWKSLAEELRQAGFDGSELLELQMGLATCISYVNQLANGLTGMGAPAWQILSAFKYQVAAMEQDLSRAGEDGARYVRMGGIVAAHTKSHPVGALKSDERGPEVA